MFSRSGAHILLATTSALAVLDARSLSVLQTLQARTLTSLTCSCLSVCHVFGKDFFKG